MPSRASGGGPSEQAIRLARQGLRNEAIALCVGVAASTVARWFSRGAEELVHSVGDEPTHYGRLARARQDYLHEAPPDGVDMRGVVRRAVARARAKRDDRD